MENIGQEKIWEYDEFSQIASFSCLLISKMLSILWAQDPGLGQKMVASAGPGRRPSQAGHGPAAIRDPGTGSWAHNVKNKYKNEVLTILKSIINYIFLINIGQTCSMKINHK